MASGFGSNFQELIDGVADGRIPNSRIIRLIVNRKSAYAVKRAENGGIPWDYFNLISDGFLPKGEKDEAKVSEARYKYDAALAEKVLSASEDQKPELIVLAGWMHVFSAGFLQPIQKAGIKVINLHPALPGIFTGEFEGANAIERAYDQFKAGKLTRTGIMAHYVILEVDRGEPIMTQEIPWEGEGLEDFTNKVHSYEHKLIVNATAKVVQDVLASRK
ncbi:phosphoribosylglycinamide formyltransferase [Geosmithia morbida]|uniref:phosphoribosylglycinamide formyltransferase 1 n=1 Tax=Geosmithia morbida TaxID=1094350 RepID=A0A9P4YPS2_9HYPO|nr:phosphoribosylglycinamide formyltransferase [Geosmithia morbida]KAF4120327.1 phosphoribosylglycinamide formyltransferase [Geosmithia morbida]